jgi:cell division protein FtsB
MTNASTQTGPAGPGAIESPVSQRTLVARRRRILLLAVLVVVAAVALAANYGPIESYVDARARLDKAAAKVAALEEQKAELQSRLGKLTEAEYLETLAREELTYARAGEDVYIVTAAPEDPGATEPGADGEPASGSAADEPGPLERWLSAFLDLF